MKKLKARYFSNPTLQCGVYEYSKNKCVLKARYNSYFGDVACLRHATDKRMAFAPHYASLVWG